MPRCGYYSSAGDGLCGLCRQRIAVALTHWLVAIVVAAAFLAALAAVSNSPEPRPAPSRLETDR